MQAVLLIGIQGAGKTSFYEQRFAATHVRISLDVLGSRVRERALINECLASGQDFVIDNTNLFRRERAAYLTLVHGVGGTAAGYFFKPNLRGSIGRNLHRGDKKPVPVPAVIAAFKRLEPPDAAEGFDELYVVEPHSVGQFTVSAYDRPADKR